MIALVLVLFSFCFFVFCFFAFWALGFRLFFSGFGLFYYVFYSCSDSVWFGLDVCLVGLLVSGLAGWLVGSLVAICIFFVCAWLNGPVLVTYCLCRAFWHK